MTTQRCFDVAFETHVVRLLAEIDELCVPWCALTSLKCILAGYILTAGYCHASMQAYQ